MVPRLVAMAAGGLAMAFAAAPISALHSQVTQGEVNSPQPVRDQANPTQGAQAEVRADSAFILDVATDNIAEVRLGRLAADKAANASVKEFGQRMVTEHTNMQKQLLDIASKQGIRLYDELSRSGRADAERVKEEVDRLEKLRGAEFDRNYMTLMIQNHQNAVSKFQSQGRFAQSAEVRNLVTASLPALQQHLSQARQIGAQVGADTDVAVTQNQPGANQNQPVAGQTWPVSRQKQQVIDRDVRADREFIQNVGAGNFMLDRLAEMAQKKARDSEVRKFAEREAADHSTLQDRWSSVTSSKPGMGPLHRAKVTRLEQASDRNFDRTYMTLMIRQHYDMVTYWQKEGRTTQSSEVRQLVNQGLPTLERHFSEAKRIGRRVGVDPEAVLRNRPDIAQDRERASIR